MRTSIQPESYLPPNGRDNNCSEVCSNQGSETMEDISVCQRKTTSKYSRFERNNDYSCDDGALRLIAFSVRRTLFRLYNTMATLIIHVHVVELAGRRLDFSAEAAVAADSRSIPTRAANGNKDG